MSRTVDDPALARALLAFLREDRAAIERAAPRVHASPEAFYDLAEATELSVWIHARLEDEDRLELLGPAREPFERRRKRCALDNMLLLAQVERALDALLAAGVRPIALKGLDTLHRFHARFDRRTLDDVDLLVRREELGTCLDALEAAGWSHLDPAQRDHYLRSSHHLPIHGPGPVPVLFEIHWNLVQEERYRLDPGDLFARAESLDVAGRSILRLENHDLVAHLLVHHFAHYFDRRLKWAVDLRFATREPGFSWTAVADRIRSWGADVTAAAALEHLRRWVPDWIPASALEAMPLSPARRALLAPLRSSHPLDYLRGTRSRRRQLWIAALLYERPSGLPGWMWHRLRRGSRSDLDPLEAGRAQD